MSVVDYAKSVASWTAYQVYYFWGAYLGFWLAIGKLIWAIPSDLFKTAEAIPKLRPNAKGVDGRAVVSKDPAGIRSVPLSNGAGVVKRPISHPTPVVKRTM
eukprot:jgi/Chrzof1/1857/Cz10g23260.t1